jgi:prepilin-type N-terminal cleavage/methylation domain-containing protein
MVNSKLVKKQLGFTVIELTVTIVIIAVLSAAAAQIAFGIFGKANATIQSNNEISCYNSLKSTVGMNPNYTTYTDSNLALGKVCPPDMINAVGTGLQNAWGGTVTVSVLDATLFPDHISFVTDEVEVDSCSDFTSKLGEVARGVGIDAGGTGTYVWVKDSKGFGGSIINETQGSALLTACLDSNNDNVVTVMSYYR